jgi:hypothetical protein
LQLLFLGRVAGENKGEALLAQPRLQPKPEASVELDSEVKEAFFAKQPQYRLEAKFTSVTLPAVGGACFSR